MSTETRLSISSDSSSLEIDKLMIAYPVMISLSVDGYVYGYVAAAASQALVCVKGFFYSWYEGSRQMM